MAKSTQYMILASYALVASALLSSITPVQASGLDTLRPHRAVYDLKLREASDRSGITGMNGRIVYEMTGSRCDGFATRFRFFTQVQTSRKSFTNDQRTTTFESGDGKNYNFVQQSYLNGQLEEEMRGKAERTDVATVVEVTKPSADPVTLGPSVFMTQHIASILDAAEREESVFQARVFDGSDTGDQLMDTTAIIGKRKPQAISVEGEAEETSIKFDGEPAWPVSVSYFTTTVSEEKGEKLPSYQVSFLLHPSGVSRSLKLQYEDYSLKGDLKQIDYLPQEPCSTQ